MFKLNSKYSPTGDQPEAIKKLIKGLDEGVKDQTLLGVTGSGKTFTIANIIKESNRPALILAPNKTLAAQLFAEYRSFFPKCSRIFCFVLWLLSTRSLYSNNRYLYRERFIYKWWNR